MAVIVGLRLGLHEIRSLIGAVGPATFRLYAAFECERRRGLSVGVPRLLFTGPYLDSGAYASSHDISRDGQRILVVQASDEERAPRRLHLVQHWFDEVKVNVSTTRCARQTPAAGGSSALRGGILPLNPPTMRRACAEPRESRA